MNLFSETKTQIVLRENPSYHEYERKGKPGLGS